MKTFPLFFLPLLLLQSDGNLQKHKEVKPAEMFGAVYKACTDKARTKTPLHDGIPLSRDVENCQAGAHAAQHLLEGK
jgi:hypothetical protein